MIELDGIRNVLKVHFGDRAADRLDDLFRLNFDMTRLCFFYNLTCHN